MKKTSLLFLVLICSLIQAFADDETSLFSDRELKNKIPFFISTEGVRLLDIPLCRQEKCQAALMLKQSRTMPKVTLDMGPGGKNPATLFCEKLDGKAKTFYKLTHDEVGICAFEDESMIDAWDLYRAHYSKRASK